MVYRATVSFFVAAILFATNVPAQVSWPTYQANASHDGYISVSFDPVTFERLWETKLNTVGIRVNPVVAADGTVFASLDAHQDSGIDHFFALDAMSGAVLWETGYGPVFSVNPPAYSDEKVYLQVGKTSSGSGGCRLYEYDSESGVLIHDGEFSCQWEKYYSPTIADGKIYINGGYYGGMYSFDFSMNPPEQWFAWLNQDDQWTPAVDSQYAYAYTLGYNAGVSIIDVNTGVVLWTIPDLNFDWPGYGVNQAPVLGGNQDLLVIEGGRLISFDLSSLSIRYEVEDGFSGQSSVRQGVVYAINNGNLEARDQLNGDFLWRWEVPVDWQLVGSMIISDTHAIVHARYGPYGEPEVTYAIDIDTHQDVWSYPVGGELAWSEGVLFIARRDGVLVALDAPSIHIFAETFESGDTFGWSATVP